MKRASIILYLSSGSPPSALNTHHALRFLAKAYSPLRIGLQSALIYMSLAPLPLTLPPPNVTALLQHVTTLLASPSILHMLAPHIGWKPRALDLDDFGGHLIEVLCFEAVEVWVSVVGLDGVCAAGVGVCDRCAREE